MLQHVSYNKTSETTHTHIHTHTHTHDLYFRLQNKVSEAWLNYFTSRSTSSEPNNTSHTERYTAAARVVE